MVPPVPDEPAYASQVAPQLAVTERRIRWIIVKAGASVNRFIAIVFRGFSL